MGIVNIAILYLAIFLGHCSSEKSIYVRKNAKDMTDEEWNSFKRGIEVMKAKNLINPPDPTSYIYQANIHGYEDYYGQQGKQIADKYNWHKCQHGHYFFLPWHRMYLYYFERILRSAANDSNLTIPYWDYKDGSIPEVFRKPSNSSNPLYIKERCHNVNEGKPLPNILLNYSDALYTLNFAVDKFSALQYVCSSFGGVKININDEKIDRFDNGLYGALEYLPHNQIHLYLGGFMADNCRASRDPIFWLHHANIDRLWETWLNLTGRQNPTDEQWLNESFTWYNESGNEVHMKVKDVLDTVNQLHYKYDQLAEAPTSQPKSIQWDDGTLIAEHETRVIIRPENTSVIFFIKPEERTLLKDIASNPIGDNIKFIFHLNTTIIKPNVLFDIYINLPNHILPGEPQSQDYYVRPLAALGCTSSNEITETTRCFDITYIYKTILKEGKISDIYTVNVTFELNTCEETEKCEGESWMIINHLQLFVIRELVDYPPCDGNGWVAYKDEKCFKLIDEMVTHEEAEKICNKESSQKFIPTLASITSEIEQEYLTKFIFNTARAVDNVWIGAKRRVENTSQFEWSDGSDFVFTNWGKGSPSNDVERDCVQMDSKFTRQIYKISTLDEDAINGKWSDVPCRKKNMILCQKSQNWSFIQLQKSFLKVRKELRETLEDVTKELNNTKNNLEELQRNPVPIGFIYVQLPGQQEPKNLWPMVVWTNVTSNYSGLFFRVEGGGSARFGEIQPESCPRLINVRYQSTYDVAGLTTVDIQPGIWSKRLQTYITGSSGMQFLASFEEVRPRNQAIRIWKRTK